MLEPVPEHLQVLVPVEYLTNETTGSPQNPGAGRDLRSITMPEDPVKEPGSAFLRGRFSGTLAETGPCQRLSLAPPSPCPAGCSGQRL